MKRITKGVLISIMALFMVTASVILTLPVHADSNLNKYSRIILDHTDTDYTGMKNSKSRLKKLKTTADNQLIGYDVADPADDIWIRTENNRLRAFTLPREYNKDYKADLLKVYYDNCGEIFGRQTDIVVTVKQVRIGSKTFTNADVTNRKNGIMFAFIAGDNMHFGSMKEESGNNEHGADGAVNVRYYISVYEHRDGKSVGPQINMPWGLGIYDVDIKNDHVTEGVSVNSDHFNRYITWGGEAKKAFNGNTDNPPDISGNTILATANKDWSDNNSKTKVGLVAIADDSLGTVSVTSRVGANVANAIEVYKAVDYGEFTIRKKAPSNAVSTSSYNFEGIEYAVYKNAGSATNLKKGEKTGPNIVLNKEGLAVDESGKAAKFILKEGEYVIQEVKGNDWYMLNSTLTRMRIEGNKSITVEPVDEPGTKTVTVKKKVTGRGAPEDISGIQFTLINTKETRMKYTVNLGKNYDIQKNKLTDGTRNYTVFYGVPYGTYSLSENSDYAESLGFDPKEANKTYTVTVTKNGVTIKNDKTGAVEQTETVEYENKFLEPTEEFRLIIEKEIENSDDSTEDFRFEVYDKENELVGTGVTEGNPGKCSIELPGEGKYKIKEVADKAGYAPVSANPMTVIYRKAELTPEITMNGYRRHYIYKKEVKFTNKKVYPAIRVTKYEKLRGGQGYGRDVEGIKFRLCSENGTILAEKLTVRDPEDPAKGTVTFTGEDIGVNIEPGTYMVKETDLDEKYKSSWATDPDDGLPTASVVVGSEYKEFVDVPEVCYNLNQTNKFTLHMTKTSAIESYSHLSEYDFENIKYTVYTKKTGNTLSEPLEKKIILDKNGEGSISWETTDGADDVTVYVKETDVPENSGYKASEDVYEVTAHAYEVTELNSGEPVTDEPKTGTLTLIKSIRCLACQQDHEKHDAPDPSMLTFTLTNNEDPGISFSAVPVQNSPGSWESTVTFPEMPVGTYTLTESGNEYYTEYMMASVYANKTVTIKEGTNTLNDPWVNEITPQPEEHGYTLKIIKKSDTQVDSPLYSLEGIRFNVYRDEDLTDLMDTVTVHGNGLQAAASKLYQIEKDPATFDVYIQEAASSVPSYYQADDQIKKVTLIRDAAASVEFTDTANTADLEFTKRIFTNTSGAAVPGPQKLSFSLLNTDSNIEYTASADAENGNKVSFSNIPIGSYVLTEKGCEKYTFSDMPDHKGRMVNRTGVLDLTIHAGMNGIGTAGNEYLNEWIPEPERVTYGLKMTKVSTEDWNLSTYSLSGITYSVYTDPDCRSEDKVGEILLKGNSTRAEGETTITMFDTPDTMPFYVKEDTPPDDSGFKASNKVYSVTGVKDEVIDVKDGFADPTDINKKGSLSFTKIITCTTDKMEAPSPEYLTFTLTNKEDSSVTFSVHPNSEGVVSFGDNLPLGKYTLTESGLEQYDSTGGKMIDLTGQLEVTIREGDNNRINADNEYENLFRFETASLDIIKQTEFPLPDKSTFSFTVYRDRGNGDLETVVTDHFDQFGEYHLTDLLPGNYIVRENLTPEQAEIYIDPGTQTREVRIGRQNTMFINNEYKKTTIKVIKYCMDGSQYTEDVDGISFRLTGTTADGQQVDRILTTSNEVVATEGVAVFEDIIKGTYKVTETGFMSAGYLSPHPKEDGLPTKTVESDGVNESVVTFINYPARFSVTKKEKLENGDTGTEYIEGAEYTLFKYDDVTPSTTEEDIRESPSVSIVTDEHGQASSNELSAGTYWVYETETPDCYVDDRTLPDDFPVSSLRGSESVIGRFVKTFTLYADEDSKHTTEEITDYNRRKWPRLVFFKRDDKEQPVEGAEFTLYKYDRDRNDPVNGEPQKVTAVNEDPEDDIPDGTKMIAVTDDTGSILQEKADGSYQTPLRGFSWGTYYLEETKVPAGYKKADTIEITFDKNGVVKEAMTEGESYVINERCKGKVRLTKYDAEDNETRLDGAVYDLYSSDGKLIAADLATGDNDAGFEHGTIEYEGLPWGSYYLKETRAPEGYLIDPEPIRFPINRYTPVNEAVTLTHDDQKASAQIVASVKIDTDSYWPEHGDPSFFVELSELDNNGNVKKIWTRPVTFNERIISETEDSHGYSAQSVTFPVKADTDYTLTTVKADRYVLDNSYACESPDGPVTGWMTGTENTGFVTGTLESGTKTKLRVPAGKTGRTTFVYTKNDWSGYGDETGIVNMIRKSRLFVAVTAIWNGDADNVESNLLYDPDDQLKVYAVFDDGSVSQLNSSEYAVTGPFKTDEYGYRRWPSAEGSYQFGVSAAVGGTMRTAALDITVLPRSKANIYFHVRNSVSESQNMPADVHIPITHTEDEINGEAVDVVSAYKNMRLGKALNGQFSILADGSLYSSQWTGHELTMWSKTPDMGAEMDQRDEINDDTHYYAIWDTSSFKIIYNDNNPRPEYVSINDMPGTQRGASGTGVTISDMIPKASSGYDFAGWSTTQAGPVQYLPGTDTYSGGTNQTDTLNLYAVWTPHQATLKYKQNDIEDSAAQEPAAGYKTELPVAMPEGTETPATIYYGDGRTAAAAPSKPGYRFTGWNTKYDGSGVSYQPGQEILSGGRDLTTDEMTNGITLHAQWEQLHLGSNELSWSAVERIGNAGIAPYFFADDYDAVRSDISDGTLSDLTLGKYTKTTTFSGSSEPVHAFIAGFDHDTPADGGGAGAITFMTYEPVSEGSMERSGYPASGWGNSYARLGIIQNLSTTDNLSSIALPVKKMYRTAEDEIQTTEDKFFLPSVEELYGTYIYE